MLYPAERQASACRHALRWGGAHANQRRRARGL